MTGTIDNPGSMFVDRSDRFRSRLPESAGFTLLELMVVLAIVALGLVLMPPLFSAGRGAADLKQATRQVVAGLRETRSRAIASNRETVFLLNVDQGTFRIGPTGSAQSLPAGIGLELLTVEAELSGAGAGAIRFYPDGGATGGEIELSQEGRTRLVVVDWLTGTVRLAE
jgi:general secretion pathway protein H